MILNTHTNAKVLTHEYQHTLDQAIINRNRISDEEAKWLDPETYAKRKGRKDERKKRNALKTLRLWKKKPEFTELYRALLREMAMPAYGKALNRITKQIDDPNPWIAQGAAREALTRFGPAIMGENENEITIKVEGMPVLGMPGQPTTDGSEE